MIWQPSDRSALSEGCRVRVSIVSGTADHERNDEVRSPGPGNPADQPRSVDAWAEREWRDFPGLPGTHLAWRAAGRRRLELVAADRSIWATLHGETVIASGQTYRISTVLEAAKRLGPLQAGQLARRDLVDATGSAVLSWTGSHFAQQADSVVTMGGAAYRFPVHGSCYKRTAIMSAVQGGGSELALIRYRLNSRMLRSNLVWHEWGPRCVEVVVAPEARAIDGIALLVAISSNFQRTYFHRAQGGA